MMDTDVSYEQMALSRHEPVTMNLIIRSPYREAKWLLNMLTDAVITGRRPEDGNEAQWQEEFHREVDNIVQLMDAMEARKPK